MKDAMSLQDQLRSIEKAVIANLKKNKAGADAYVNFRLDVELLQTKIREGLDPSDVIIDTSSKNPRLIYAIKSKAEIENLKPKNVPPQKAEFLAALFAAKKQKNSIVLELADRFDNHVALFGPHRAKRLYWAEVLRTIWPLMRALVGRHGLKVLSWLGIADFVTGFFRGWTH